MQHTWPLLVCRVANATTAAAFTLKSVIAHHHIHPSQSLDDDQQPTVGSSILCGFFCMTNDQAKTVQHTCTLLVCRVANATTAAAFTLKSVKVSLNVPLSEALCTMRADPLATSALRRGSRRGCMRSQMAFAPSGRLVQMSTRA